MQILYQKYYTIFIGWTSHNTWYGRIRGSDLLGQSSSNLGSKSISIVTWTFSLVFGSPESPKRTGSLGHGFLRKNFWVILQKVSIFMSQIWFNWKLIKYHSPLTFHSYLKPAASPQVPKMYKELENLLNFSIDLDVTLLIFRHIPLERTK